MMVDKIDVMDVFTECEPYMAADVADELEISRRVADYHLRNLADDGRVKRKKHANDRVTYWTEPESTRA